MCEPQLNNDHNALVNIHYVVSKLVERHDQFRLIWDFPNAFHMINFDPLLSSNLFSHFSIYIYIWQTALQRVQNCAACLVTCTWKREHKITVLFQVGWFPVILISLYKILFPTFKVLSGTVPLKYLRDLIEKYISVRLLRFHSYSFWGC